MKYPTLDQYNEAVQNLHAYFKDPEIHKNATAIYERVDWPWMLNGGKTFSMANISRTSAASR